MSLVLTDARLRQLADQLGQIDGIVAVMLGGSRARGDGHPDSDVDLGLYYRPPLDTAALRDLARQVATGRADQTGQVDVTEPGGWGPWVDGGGWLVVDDVPVDWIYRDLDRVQRSWRLAVAGTFDFRFQQGHPLGIPDFAYAGEVGLGRVLADPTGELTALKQQAQQYPPALGQAIRDRLDEARFMLGALGKSAGRGDVTFVTGCLFRVVCLCAHAVQAASRRWVITEKGLIDEAAAAGTAPADFAARAHGILTGMSSDPVLLTATVAEAVALVDDVSAATRQDANPGEH